MVSDASFVEFARSRKTGGFVDEHLLEMLTLYYMYVRSYLSRKYRTFVLPRYVGSSSYGEAENSCWEAEAAPSDS